ncbi:13042_t:CDS:2, partial [Gigaspora rosea]
RRKNIPRTRPKEESPKKRKSIIKQKKKIDLRNEKFTGSTEEAFQKPKPKENQQKEVMPDSLKKKEPINERITHQNDENKNPPRRQSTKK